VNYFDWNQEKNEQLKKEREVSFEEVLIALSENRLLDILKHKNQKKYPVQRILVININEYVYLVPFIEDEKKIFLKTIIPSRKATKKYLIIKKTK
jgi:uncharacterized DUF497 family protein